MSLFQWVKYEKLSKLLRENYETANKGKKQFIDFFKTGKEICTMFKSSSKTQTTTSHKKWFRWN